AGQECDPSAGALLEPGQRLADPAGVDVNLGEPDRPGRVAPLRLGALRQDAPNHLVGGPTDGRYRGDAQPLVDLGAAGVVDPGDHGADTERLPGHARCDDVGVVAAGHRHQRLGVLDTRGGHDLAVEAGPGGGRAAEVGAWAAGGVRVLIDQGHRVTAVVEYAR